MEKLAQEVVSALAAARADPRACAARIRKRLSCYDGNQYAAVQISGAPQPVKVTKEGTAAVLDAISFLETQEALPGFCEQAITGLSLASADHIADVGGEGVASHVGSDGSSSWDRISRYGEWEGACGECLWYGTVGPWMNGESVVDDLIVDDGVMSRGHRLAVFDPRYTMCGATVESHKTFHSMVAIEFAAEYEDNMEAIAARLHHGVPVLQRVADARAGERRTQWQLGRCRGCMGNIEGGRVVETATGKWHSQCFCCTQCQVNLVGVKQKKEENGRVFCQNCWVQLYAPSCCVCQQKIAGDRVKKGEKYRHPTCRSPPTVRTGLKLNKPASPPAALNSVKVNKTGKLGARKAVMAPMGGMRVSNVTVTNSASIPLDLKQEEEGGRGAHGMGLLGAELVSTNRTERMVSKYRAPKATSSVSGKGKRSTCRKAVKLKPSFTDAGQSLNSMAMGYGDLLA